VSSCFRKSLSGISSRLLRLALRCRYPGGLAVDHGLWISISDSRHAPLRPSTQQNGRPPGSGCDTDSNEPELPCWRQLYKTSNA
jgi:hypothetical protein